MKYCGRTLVFGLVAVAVNAGAIVSVSDAKGRPYRAIERRNLFGLVPMVDSRTEPNTPVVTRAKIKLVGTTTLLGKKMAFLMLPPDKSGGLPDCLLLGERDAQKQIQVMEINERAMREAKEITVRIINQGEEQTLRFEDPMSIPPNAQGHPDQSPMQMPAPEKPLTPEQQVLVIEAQRLKAMQDGDPVAKILPPTEFTAEITDGTR